MLVYWALGSGFKLCIRVCGRQKVGMNRGVNMDRRLPPVSVGDLTLESPTKDTNIHECLTLCEMLRCFRSTRLSPDDR